MPGDVADVYASVAELSAQVGSPQGQDDRLALALVTGSRYVDQRLGYYAPDPAQAEPVPGGLLPDPLVVTVVAAPPGAKLAALVAAGRHLRSPDLTLGVAGGLGDLAVRVYQDIPEADLHLFGLRRSWGVA
jgi:hypothetical protein